MSALVTLACLRLMRGTESFSVVPRGVSGAAKFIRGGKATKIAATDSIDTE